MGLHQKGQGMVGVLVSAALLVVMITAVFQVLENTYKSQKSVSVSGEYSNYVVELTQILSDLKSCKIALLGQKVYPAATVCTSANVDTIVKWEGGRNYLQVGTTTKGLTVDQLCVKKVDDAWDFMDAKKRPVKLYVEFSKAGSTGGRQKFAQEFFFNVLTDTSTPPLIQDCIEYFSATPTPAPTPTPCASPAALAISHTANNRLFKVSWTAGRCNDGENGCRLEYQRADGNWMQITTPYVNCDATLTTRDIYLPRNSWDGSPPVTWASIPVRLVRVRDDNLMGAVGNVTCASIAPPGGSTPDIDENCDARWDDEPATTTSTTTTTLPTTTTLAECSISWGGTFTTGDPPNCPGDPRGQGSCPGSGTFALKSHYWGGNGSQSPVSRYSDASCTAFIDGATNMFYYSSSAINAPGILCHGNDSSVCCYLGSCDTCWSHGGFYWKASGPNSVYYGQECRYDYY